jgi:hypothetical protein
MFLVWIATNKHQIEKIGEQTHGFFPGLHQEDLKFLMKAVSSVEFCFLRIPRFPVGLKHVNVVWLQHG